MSYRDYLTEDRRLVILRILKEASGSSANCRIVQKLLSRIGHEVTLDRVKTDAVWLEEQGLITTSPFDTKGGSQYLVMKLTRRGRETADGIAKVPGVAEPTED